MSDIESFAAQAADELLACWKGSPQPSVKITSYFPIYAHLFQHLRGTRCTFVETGVLDGGSLFMWREWFGKDARIIGIDLNPEAARWRDHGFEIIVGDQGDRSFWREAFGVIGSFDALLDDGGHQSFQQIVTATEAIRAAQKRCLVVVEDTSTSFMRDFARHGSHSFLNFAKDLSDLLIAPLAEKERVRFPSALNTDAIGRYSCVKSVEFHCGIVAFRCDPHDRTDHRVARNRPPNSAGDFRYEGIDRADVAWPRLFGSKSVKVKGGMTVGTKMQAVKSRLRRIVSGVR